MKCQACGFEDPVDTSANVTKFCKIDGGGMLRIESWRDTADLAHAGHVEAGWHGSDKAELFACPKCGTVRVETT